MNSYSLLIARLDEFIRKYYLNQLLRGLIYTSALLLALFLVVTFLESLLFLPSVGRKILFFGYLGLAAFVAFRWVIMPGLQYARLGKLISHEQAASIIGKHFTNVEDKLLNILQLKKQSEGLGDASLINASINQKIETLKPVPFTTAIDLRGNRKYLKYLAVPVLAFVVILFAAPSIITDGTTRLVFNGTSFEKPAPFRFKVLNNKLQALQYSDFEVRLTVEGDALPNEVSINQGGYTYKMLKDKNGEFAYKFFNLQKDMEFNFSAAGFDSKEYELIVTPKPMIVGFNIALDYPTYIGRKDEVLSNTGDVTVPEGTKVIWDFNGKAASDIAMYLGDTLLPSSNRQKDHFVFTKVVNQSSTYTLKVSGEDLPNADSITYTINVTPDQHPAITVKEFQDSVDNTQYRYFTGEISDDYGLRALAMKYKIERDGQTSDKWEIIPLAFNRASSLSPFNHYWELQKLGLKPGDNVTYYFEVWDNDAINGSKSGRTPFMKLQMPTADELDELTAQNNENLKSQMESSMKMAQELQNDIRDLKDKMIDKKNLNWEDKKAIEEMMKKQDQLQQNLDQIKEDFSKNQDKQEYKEFSPDVVQKQQQLEKLFEEVLSDELKELFDKLDKMMEDLSKQEMMKELENFEMTDEQLEKELDRMLSLFKQLEMEQKMDETIKKLDELAKKQEELSKQTENADNKQKEDLAKKQEELNKEFDKLKEDMADLEKLNKESESNMPLEELNDEMSGADQEMDQAKENIDGNKNKKASQNQKNAAEQMKKMSQSMAQMQDQQQMEQMEMDMKALRQLLDNLLKLSFDQEELMAQLKKANINEPEYVSLVQKQKKLKDDTEMVEDSLYALAKRIAQIESFVTDEIRAINKNMGKGIERMEQRDKYNAGTNQQYVMTGFNNLALMFSEVMDQMQQEMAQQMPGANCNKPGNNKKPGSSSMSQMQKQLNDQLEKMQKEMGNKPGMKPGQKPGEGGMGGMSKEMAKAAAQQKMIRDAVKQMMDMAEGDKAGQGELKKLLDEMDKTETELVNKQITAEMMKRQQEIMTKLLEAEEAMRQRETDNKRESETANTQQQKMPPSLEEYLKKREAEIQLYKTLPPSLKPYYKNLVESYFKNINL